MSDPIKVGVSSTYPCGWDELRTDEGPVATIYSKKAVDTFGLKLKIGFTLNSTDRSFDIVVEDHPITLNSLREAIAQLSEWTGKNYILSFDA